MLMLISFFNEVDFFGFKPSLYVNRRTNYSSVLGGIISILIFVSIIIGFIFICKDYSKQFTIFIFSNKVTSVKEYVSDFDNFLNKIRIGFQIGQFEVDYNVHLKNQSYIREYSGGYTVKSYLQFNDYWTGYQSEFDLDTFLCDSNLQVLPHYNFTEKSNSNKTSLQTNEKTRTFLWLNSTKINSGFSNTARHFFDTVSNLSHINFLDMNIKIDFFPCLKNERNNSSSSSSLCYSTFKYGNKTATYNYNDNHNDKDLIPHDSPFLDLLYSSNLVNFINDNNNGNYNGDVSVKNLNDGNSQLQSDIISFTRNSISNNEEISLSYRKFEIYTDSFDISSAQSRTQGYHLESHQKNSNILNGNDSFLSIKINLSKLNDVYYCKLPKTIKILSEIGGLIYFFTNIGKLIICIYNKSLENIYLLNRMFYLKCEETDYSKKMMETENIKIFNLSQNIHKNNIVTINNKLENFKIDKRRDLNISCLSRFFFVETCLRLRRSKKAVRTRKALEIIKDKLDIGNIFKMQLNIEKLKYLICSREQSLVLEYLDKVEMTRIEAPNGDSLYVFYDFWLNPQLVKKDDINRAIFQIKISESEIDKKISELIN